jgi:hypothetical protein
MPENNGSDRLDRIEKALEVMTQNLGGLTQNVTAMQKVIVHLADKFQAFDERQDRIQRHLEVLIDVVDGQIRDRRFKELEKRVSDLEERSGEA